MKKEKTKISFKKRLLIIILSVLGLIIIFMAVGILATSSGRNEIKDMQISNIPFNGLKDGTYIGEYVGTKDNFRDTEGKITVLGGKITDIKVTKGILSGKEASELNTKKETIYDLFDRIISSQSLGVDIISGATLTSKTHLKAVENAVEKSK